MSLKDKLAVNGGEKAITSALSARGSMSAEEKAAVDALFDAAISQGEAIGYNGPEEEALCREFAEYMGGGYADAVNSGTNSVFVALKALNPEPFSEVIVSAVTDPGGIMPILACNCIPVVADAAPGCYNTSAAEIEKMITPLTAAIIVAHIAGEPIDMVAVMDVARRHNIKVVEDCSQSHHAKLNGKIVGTFGDVAAFSTMFGKHHNTGGQGGIVFTKCEDLYWKVRQTADRGKPFGLPAGSTNCVASLNYNLNEIGAAIGRVQLRKLPSFVEGRQAVAAKLAAGFAARVPSVKVPSLVPGAEHSYWFWRLEADMTGLSCTKDEYCAALGAEGVPLSATYKAALPHHMDWFKQRRAFGTKGFPWTSPEYKGDNNRDFPTPNAIEAMDRQFNLYFNESWTDADVETVIAAFEKVDRAFRA